MKKVMSLILSAFLTFGCVPSPDGISAAYVSPLQYRSLKCSQLLEEYRRVNYRAIEVTKFQRAESEQSTGAMAVGLILFWPALFFVSGTDRSPELARLRGEVEAIEKTAIRKECYELTETIREERSHAKVEAEQAAKKQKQQEEEEKELP